MAVTGITTLPVPGTTNPRPHNGVTYVVSGTAQCPYAPTLLSGHIYVTSGGLTGCWSSRTKPQAVKGVEPEPLGECAICYFEQMTSP